MKILKSMHVDWSYIREPNKQMVKIRVPTEAWQSFENYRTCNAQSSNNNTSHVQGNLTPTM